MAFQIHTDSYERMLSKKPKTKIESKKVENNCKGTEVFKKRLPLQSTNNYLDKNFEAEKKIEKQIENNTKKAIEKENQVPQNIKISDDISQLNNNNNNAVVESEENHFYFSIDDFYLTTCDYHDNIFVHLLMLEKKLKRPKSNYMSKQPELSPKMRCILVDWLSLVAEEHNMQPQTFHLAVQYIDYFLVRMSVAKKKFQLVGTAAMMIAAKLEEIYPPGIKEWASLTADTFTTLQILRMEKLILSVLHFNVNQPTAYTFITHISYVGNLPKKVTLLAMYISELVLLEGEDYCNFYPSQLAFAAVAVAKHTLNEKELWPEYLEKKTGYSLKQLSPIIKKQHNTFKESPKKEQQAIQEKFQTAQYGRVALFKAKELKSNEIIIE